MARPGVSYFDVSQVAVELVGANELPTIDRVRQKLGTGSNSTIANHLKQWKAENMPTVSTISKSTLPASLLAQLQSLWDDLKTNARTELERQQEEHAQQISQAEQTLLTLRESYGELQQAHTRNQTNSDSLQTALNGLQAENDQQALTLREIEARYQAQEQRLEDKETTIGDMKIQLKHLSDNLEHFQEAAQKQRQQDSLDYASQISRHEQRTQELLARIEKEQQRHQAVIIEQELMGFRADQLALESTHNKTQLEESARQTVELKLNLQSAKQSIGELKSKIGVQEERTKMQDSQLIGAENKLSASTATIETLLKQTQRQENKIDSLHQQNMDLAQENSNLKARVSLAESR